MSKTTSKTDPSVAFAVSNPDSLPEFQNFEEEQISLPPYLELKEVGQWFYAMPVFLDDKDPEFIRFIMKAEMPTKCQRGSRKKGENEPVLVNKDEFFTLSAYTGLPLDRYIGVPVLVKYIGDKDVGRPQLMKEFSLKVSPEHKKMLNEDRKKLAADGIRRFREQRKIAELSAHEESIS
jgi:hypothetical protein